MEEGEELGELVEEGEERRAQEEIDVIDKEEVRQAIKTMKNGKSTGWDGLNNELYKTGDAVVG